MRSLALFALAAIPTLAWAAPTPEEEALRAALEGRTSDAVRILERDSEPRSRWIAGRHALLARDYAASARLFSGAELRDVWGRIDLSAARGELANAAALALAQMDGAVAGTHRDALAQLLVGWAGERAETDPAGAARFLLAATGLAPSAAIRNAAEDALYRLAPDESAGGVDAARRRLEADPTNVPARLRVAVDLAESRPLTAAAWLTDLAAKAERPDALAAAHHLVTMDIPDPLVLDALTTLAARFPGDAAIARLRLDHAVALAARDPERALTTLAVLEGVEAVAGEAREARAEATRDPAARRALWLAIAQREGASAKGDAAWEEAYDALIAGVYAAGGAPVDGARRAKAAQAALDTPDGAGTPELLYLAIPPGDGRTAALEALATRFPDGAWCDELGDRLVVAGASREAAERYAGTCTSPSSVGGSALYGQATGDTRLHLLPRALPGGGVDVTASAADVLRVSQHRVDPEALFRATDGHPLDAQLDAFLLEPDLTWEVAQPDGIVKTRTITPRGGGPLAAITVRAGDQRGTALVVADPLDVQIVRRGDDVAVGVLRGGAPAGGVDLLILDAAGGSRRARTDAGGVGVLHGLGDAVRVMARKGNALGFATAGATGGNDPVADAWSVVPWDRAVPAEGAVVDVSVFGSRVGGDAPATVHLQSRDATRGVLEDVPVTLVAGAAHARLFVMGRGSVAIMDGAEDLAVTTVRPSAGARPPVRVTWEPAAPRPGERVVASVVPIEPLGPGGLAGVVTVGTEWSLTTTPIVLGPEGARFPVDLGTAADGAGASLTFQLPDGRSWSGAVQADDADSAEGRGAARPALQGTIPSVVAPGAPFAVEVPAGGWLRATSPEGHARWARAGEPIALPTVGTWELCAWRGACGPSTPVVVVEEPIGADGRWDGPPVLAAITAEGLRSARFLRPGDALLDGDARGTRRAWALTADAAVPALPIRGAEAPEIAVSGSLVRGGTSTLDVGAGLPAGTKVWAFLRDGSEWRPGAAAAVAAPWDGDAGGIGDAWAPEARWGEAIAAALLEEEERLAEATDIERVDFGFSAAAEVGGLGGIGTRGYGMGGGGSAGDIGSFGAVGRGGRAGVDPGFVGDPRALGVVEGAAPGPLRFDVPTWVPAADLELVVHTPDGRWASRSLRLDVGGAPLTAMPVSSPPPIAEAWDGSDATLLPIARALPGDAREYALTALAKAGVPGAEVARRAAASQGPASGASAVLAAHLGGLRGGSRPSADLEALPDLRRADRAVAALTLAASDPDRARAAAARLLKTPGLEPWARARAGLALWVAGAPDEAGAALVGDEPVVAAARAVVTGKADPRFAPAWWTTAREPGAQPSDRALAIHALTLLDAARPVAALPAAKGGAALALHVDAALAEWRGETFRRGAFEPGDAPLVEASVATVPAGRAVPVTVVVPPSALPTRLACPAAAGAAAAWIDLPSATEPRTVRCTLRLPAPGAASLVATWRGPDGAALGVGRAALTVEPARDSAPGDAMSPSERLGFGLRLVAAGDADGIALLERLLAEVALPPVELERASTAILAARRDGAPAALIDAFQRYREQVPGGALDLGTAAALAHAYAATGDPKRALAATRVVMDARFKEELGAVSQLQEAGLGLTSLKLLRELVDRYPETPTVVTARYLAPSMLLHRAEGDEDRLGYTRSSLRHTAAAELAAFLLLHPDAEDAPEAAALLVDALHALGDPSRERALAGPLARRYRDDAAAWRLSLADARATLAAGQPAAAARILDALSAPSEGRAEVELERGRALEALGRLGDARAAYERSGAAEASERRAWLDREDLALPPTLVLAPGAPPRVKGSLRPGAEVTVTAIRVLLEAALLRDDGRLDPWSLNVAGLKPTASRTLTVGADGDVPLPALPDGAYIVTVTTGAASGRMIVVRTDAELTVDSRAGGGTLVHLADTGGAALADAQLWLFAGGGGVTVARTDGVGAAYVPYGDGTLGVLAKRGDRYALANLDGSGVPAPPTRAPNAPAAGYGDVLRKNEAAYDRLFQQDAEQKIGASAL